MLDGYVLGKARPLTIRVATRLSRTGVTAEQVSWAGFACGMIAALLIASGHSIPAMAAIALNRVCDGLDGAVARIEGPTDRGAFLDISLDFLFYASVPLAFAYADPAGHALAAATLIFAFVGTGTSFLAFAILAERRGITNTRLPGKGFHYLGGLTEATETIAVFMAMCLLPGFFAPIAYVFAALCGVTIITRLHAGLTLLR